VDRTLTYKSCIRTVNTTRCKWQIHMVGTIDKIQEYRRHAVLVNKESLCTPSSYSKELQLKKSAFLPRSQDVLLSQHPILSQVAWTGKTPLPMLDLSSLSTVELSG